MTDRPDDDRAERAFRAAFDRHAAGAPTEPLEVRRGERRRRRVPYAAAAAVLAVLGGLGVTQLSSDSPRTDVTDPPATHGSLPVPEPGHRWVSWRNVAVQVPETWGFGKEPGTDWCARTGQRAQVSDPYVDLNAGHGLVLDIRCLGSLSSAHDELFGPAPKRLWTTHVALEAADGPDRIVSDGGWTVQTRTVAGVRVRLLTDDRDATDGILDSARTFTTDHNGCDATSPVQAEWPVRPPDPFDVTEIFHVDSISVCQYDRPVAAGSPALAGSRVIDGQEAAHVLHAFQTAPPGGGPDQPQNCTDTMHGDTALVVRLRTGDETRDVYTYFDWCTDNGSDDGTTRRGLTPDTCARLFGGPVVAWSYQSNLRQECGSGP